jgi:flagellar motor switch protein FliM
LRIGDIAGTLNLGIPSIVLKLLGKRFEQKHWAMRRKEDVARDQERIRGIIAGTLVGVRVEIGNSSLSIRDFLGLQPGDIVSLNHSIHEPVVVVVEGVPRFQGGVVRLEERVGVLIENQASAV